MRVGLVVYGSLTTTTGGFLYDRRLVEHLQAAGDAVEVISLPRRSYARGLLDNLDVGLRRRLSTASVDVLVQDELCHPSLFWLNRRLEAGTPVVSVVHHLRSSEPHAALRRWLYRRVERRYLRTVDGVVATNRAAREAAERLGTDAPGVVAYPGTGRFDPDVRPADVDDRAHEPGPLRVLFVGTLVPRKGAHVLVRGLARLPEKAWRLTIIGDRTAAPAYVARLERTVDRLGLRDAVALTGAVPEKELEIHLREGHVLAVPSTYEGFGMAYLEGMGFGLVPLATAAGGASELVTDGETGLLVPPADAGAVARRLAPLLEDRDRLASLGRAATHRYEVHPTWDESMAAVRELVATVAAGRGSGANV